MCELEALLHVQMFVHLFACASFQPCATHIFACANYQPCCTCSYLSCSHARAGSPAACVDVFQIFVHVRALSSPACSYLSRWHSRAGGPAACQRKFHMSACASYQPCYTCSFVFTRPATPPVTRRASLLYIYTLLHDYNMNVNMRMLHPLHIFDVKYIVDHSVLHAQANCHNISWQCKPLHGHSNKHTPVLLHARAHCTYIRHPR